MTREELEQELAAFRKLVQDALSDAADEAVSEGARDLRKRFGESAMRRLDLEFEAKQRNDVKEG